MVYMQWQRNTHASSRWRDCWTGAVGLAFRLDFKSDYMNLAVGNTMELYMITLYFYAVPSTHYDRYYKKLQISDEINPSG